MSQLNLTSLFDLISALYWTNTKKNVLTILLKIAKTFKKNFKLIENTNFLNLNKSNDNKN